jgi:O-antigen ligase
MKNASKGTQYLQTMLSEDINETNSVTSRKKIWLRLWKMIQQKPFLGHAPYKEFFYEHKLYSENEYVLVAWRYGFIGLALYLIYLFLIPMYYFFKWKSKFNNYLYIAIVILITSLTNNPISDPRIMILYFLVLGLLFYEISKKENEEKTVVDR